MTTKTVSWPIVAVAFMAALGGLVAPAECAEPGPKEALSIVRMMDFDDCEPVKIQSKIMEVRPDTGTIVVGEREVRGMDVEDGERRIKTSYLNRAGKPEARDAFRVGQYVLVNGLLHPDGYVAAFVVQEIEKPVEKKMKYKPIELSKKGSRKARTSGGAQ